MLVKIPMSMGQTAIATPINEDIKILTIVIY